MVLEVKQIQIALGKMYFLMKSKEGHNSKPWQGRDAVHLYKWVNPSICELFLSICYLHHLSKGETRKVYSIAPGLTEFEVLFTSI